MSQINLIIDEFEQEAIKEILWQQLLAIPNPTIYQTTLNSRQLSGWLDLAIIARNYTEQPELLIRALEVWNSRYQGVIPENHIPLDLSRAMSVEVYQPEKLAVLLPLTGPLANSAEQIRRGILAAHYTGEARTELLFLDTNSADVLKLYQQAIDMNSQFVIGPLLQSDVEKLSQSEFEFDVSFMKWSVKLG